MSRRLYGTGFTRPVAFVQDPSTRNVQYVVEQGGRVRVLGNRVLQGPAYRGRYFFADFGSARVWSSGLTIDSSGNAAVDNVTEHSAELGTPVNISSFGVDASGEVYIVDYSGRIFAIDGRYSFTPGDVDGDFLTDLAIWRPTDGVWYPLTSRSADTAANATPLGVVGDVPLMGDIDGDGTRDFIIWRPSTGTWSWFTSSTGFAAEAAGSKAWGDAGLGDVPLVGDIDGDGRVDLIVWRATTGEFFWLPSSTGYAYSSAGSRQWGHGNLGDEPLIGDFDGDGRSDLAVWRAATGACYWLSSTTRYASASARGAQWGSEARGDVLLLTDIDGDRRADLTVWCASSGFWYWLTSPSGFSPAAANGRHWSDAGFGDVPVVK